MQEADFFARMAPEFASHAGAARENASRQADVERLLAKAEYEFDQMRRELNPVMAGIVVPALGLAAAAAADRAVAEMSEPVRGSAEAA